VAAWATLKPSVSQELDMAAQGHFLEGKDIVVAGAGVAGIAFAITLKQQWGENGRPPRVVVYDRDEREVDLRRQGYSQTLSGM
jgi:2-polyprenyl-6-methoxyphenol hydroxylase-like FAD-dependent oxidoreductase